MKWLAYEDLKLLDVIIKALDVVGEVKVEVLSLNERFHDFLVVNKQYFKTREHAEHFKSLDYLLANFRVENVRNMSADLMTLIIA